MAKRISKEAEAKLMASLEKVANLVNDGHHPNDALIKIARDDQIVPGHLRLMTQAYNTGRTSVQRKSSEDPLEKSASFPLADAAVVLESLYPSRVKSAATEHRHGTISHDYARPPDWVRPATSMEKVAREIVPTTISSYPRDPERLVKRAVNLSLDAQREFEERRRLVSAARDKVAVHVATLDDYFRVPGNLPFPFVREQVVAYLGPPGASVMSKIAQANDRLEKQAGTAAGPVRWDREPFLTVTRLVKEAREYGRLREAVEEFDREAGAKVASVLGAFLPEPEPEYHRGSVLGSPPSKKEKRALFGGIGDALKTLGVMGVANKVYGKSPLGQAGGDSSAKADAFAAVTDPVHEARLNNMRSQFMLNDMLANDEVISGYDPHSVVNAYNQLSKLAPRAANQPMLVRALLRRYLAQGAVDTHEVDQLAGIETKLKQRDDPTDVRKWPAGIINIDLGRGEGGEKSSSVLAGMF